MALPSKAAVALDSEWIHSLVPPGTSSTLWPYFLVFSFTKGEIKPTLQLSWTSNSSALWRLAEVTGAMAAPGAQGPSTHWEKMEQPNCTEVENPWPSRNKPTQWTIRGHGEDMSGNVPFLQHWCTRITAMWNKLDKNRGQPRWPVNSCCHIGKQSVFTFLWWCLNIARNASVFPWAYYKHYSGPP